PPWPTCCARRGGRWAGPPTCRTTISGRSRRICRRCERGRGHRSVLPEAMASGRKNLVLILDFGSQTTQLIARRVREAGVYCEIHPFSVSDAKIDELKPRAIILSGGPNSVY